MDPRRAEQVRTAKRRQRQRDRSDGWKLYQIKLPADLCDRLRTGMREPAFVRRPWWCGSSTPAYHDSGTGFAGGAAWMRSASATSARWRGDCVF